MLAIIVLTLSIFFCHFESMAKFISGRQDLSYLLHQLGFFIVFLFVFTMKPSEVEAQAGLIALVLGDKVATEKFNLSMELGSVWSSYSDVSGSKRNKPGLAFGIAGNVKLSEHWFLSPNAYFLSNRTLNLASSSLNSGSDVLNDEFQNVESNVALHYIDFPTFIYYEFNNKKCRLGLAPQVSFLRSSDASYINAVGEFKQDVSEDVRNVDYGFIGSLTYVLGKAHKGKGIHIHVRYYHGFTDVFRERLVAGENLARSLSLHFSLPFITDELASRNLED